MPFGKFKGSALAELPDNYLSWLWFEVGLREPLRSGVRQELEGRGLLDTKPSAGSLDLGAVQRIYRELSFEFHPDRGGNTEAMKALNLFYERVKNL